MPRKTRKHSVKLGGITLILIPHSQKHVYRLRINSHWVYFVVFLISALTLLSVTTLVYGNKIDQQKKRVEKEMNVWNNHKWIVSREESQIDEKVRFFLEYGNQLYNLIWDDSLPPNDVNFQVSLNSLSSDEFYKIMEPLNNVLQFIIVREENFKNLPLGWPVDEGSITSGFGDRVSPFGFTTDFHTGTDFANAIGTPIKATADGKVIFAGASNTGYGIYVKILHSHGFITLYGHASKILVKENDHVKRGEVIALLGRTGSATGPHVHYEVRQEARDDHNQPYELFLNPLPFFKEKWN